MFSRAVEASIGQGNERIPWKYRTWQQRTWWIVLLAVVGGALLACVLWLSRPVASPDAHPSADVAGPRDETEVESATIVHLTDEQAIRRTPHGCGGSP